MQGLNPCHSRGRSLTGGHTKAQLASSSPVSYKLFSSPSASKQTVPNCGSRMPQNHCAQGVWHRGGASAMALVPDTVWGLLAHPGDSTSESLPQNHLGLPQARKASWEIQTRILMAAHQHWHLWSTPKPPARKKDRPPHLGPTSSLPVSLRSQRSGRTSTRSDVPAEAVAPQNHRVAGFHLWDHMA